MKNFLKKTFRLGCFSIIILSVIFAGGAYFAFPYLKNKIIRKVLKKTGLRSVDYSGLDFSKNHFDLKKLKIIRDDFSVIEISNLQAVFPDYKNFYNNKFFIDSISFDNLQMKLNIPVGPPDTRPFDLKSLFFPPDLPYNIDIKNISINSLNLQLNVGKQTFTFSGFTILSKIKNNNDSFSFQISSEKKSASFKYNFDSFGMELSSPLITCIYSVSDSVTKYEVNIKSTIHYTDKINNLRIGPEFLFARASADVDRTKKNIHSCLNTIFGNAAAFDISGEFEYDTGITSYKISASPAKINLTQLLKSVKTNFELPFVVLKSNSEFIAETPDTSSFSFKTSSDFFTARNLNLRYSIKNVDFKFNEYLLKNLKSSGKIHSDAESYSSVNLPKNFALNLSVNLSADSFSDSNNINIKNPAVSISFCKNPESRLLNFISLISKSKNINDPELIKNVISELDTYSVAFKWSKISVSPLIIKAGNFKLNGCGNEISSDISVNIDEFQIPGEKNIVPAIAASIKSKFQDLKTLSILARVNSPSLFQANISIFADKEKGPLVIPAEKENFIKEFYENAFWRIETNNLKITNEKLKRYIPFFDKRQFSGVSNFAVKLLKKTNSNPVISASAKFENLNFSDPALNLQVDDIDLNLNIENFIISDTAKTRKENSGVILNTPELDKNRNFFIKKIAYQNMNLSNLSGNLAIRQNNLYFNNVTFDFLRGSGTMNFYIDLTKNNMAVSSRLENLELSALSKNSVADGQGKFSAAIDLKIKNLNKKGKIFDPGDVSGSAAITKMNRDTVYSALNIFDPENKDFNSSKLRLALKYAEPTAIKLTASAGMLNADFTFNSKFITEFRIDRINISKLKFLKDFLNTK